jgi:hypothetical protein
VEKYHVLFCVTRLRLHQILWKSLAEEKCKRPALFLRRGERRFNLRDDPRFAADSGAESGGNFGQMTKDVKPFDRKGKSFQKKFKAGVSGNEPDDFKTVAGVENHKFMHTVDAGEHFFDFGPAGFQGFQCLEIHTAEIAAQHKQVDVLKKFNVAEEAFAQHARAAAGASGGSNGNG